MIKGILSFVGQAVLTVVLVLISPVVGLLCLAIFLWPLLVVGFANQWMNRPASESAVMWIGFAACVLWWLWVCDQK